METRANYATIGLFTLGVIIACFAFVYWLARYDESGTRRPMRILIPGAVTGLATGSQVLFNGIRIGDVTKLRINEQDPNEVEAMVSVDPTQPIKRDTKVSIGVQGLTGIASIEFIGGSPGEPNLFDEPGIPTLTAKAGGLQDLMATAQQVLDKVNSATTRINSILDTAEPSVNTSLKNVETFTDALAKNSAGVDSSDHEVNLKILLDLVVRRGSMTPGERDWLLAEVTGERELPLALHDGGFDIQHITAAFGPREAGGDTNFIFFQFCFGDEFRDA